MSDVETFAAQIDATRSAFDVARTALESELARDFVNPRDVADALLTHADEFGPAHAVDALCANPGQLGNLVPEPTGTLADRASDLTTHLEALIDTHDTLDRLTHQQQAALGRQHGPGRHLHIQGRLFHIDIDARGLVHAEPVRDDAPAHARDDALLAARVIDELKSTRAQPLPSHDRDRKPDRSR